MYRTHLFSMFVLVMLVLSACQPKAPSAQPPKDASVVQAFSKPKAACEGVAEWTIEANSQDWIDVSIEWTAIDSTTVQDNFKHLKFETFLDGKALADVMKYPTGLEPFSLTCGDMAIEGSALKYALFLPPLSKGDHKILWRVILDAEISDGWGTYPAGVAGEFTANVTVQ
jgi:hypothetical protein